MKYKKFKKINIVQIPQGFLAWRYGTADNVEIFDILTSEKRKGYGTLLIKTLLEELKENPPQMIFGFTRINNTEAQLFYSTLGFKIVLEIGEHCLFWQTYDILLKRIFKKNENSIKMKKTVITIGNARSGTSLTAGVLYHLGVRMGDTLKNASKTNERGFFEDIYILYFNIKVLENNNFYINKLPLPNLDCLVPFKRKYSEKAKELVEKSKKDTVWGWKDSRTLWTFPLFSDFIKEPYFIVNYRNLNSIAKSLEFRDRMKIEEGLALSKEYYELVEEFFKKYHYPRLNVHYEKYFTEEKESQINGICQFLEIPYKVEALNIIDPSIKHF